MKRYYKLLTVFFSVIVLLYLLVSDTQVVYASFSPAEDEFQYNSISGYSMEDDSSIPAGQHFFYHYDSGKAWYCNIQDAIALCCNKSYGISLNVNNVSSLASGFMNYVSSYTGGAPISNRAVMKDNVVVGYALNSIQNCKLVRPGGNANYQVESDINNFIYVYVIDYIENLPIDYIQFKPQHAASVALNFDNSTDAGRNAQTILTNNTNVPYTYDSTAVGNKYGLYSNPTCGSINGFCFYASSASTFNSVVNSFGLTQDTVFNAMTYLTGSVSYNFNANFKDKNGNTSVTGTRYTNYSTSNMTSTSTTYSTFQVLTSSNYKKGCTTAAEDIITIYRDSSVATSVLNNNYAPSYQTSENTYNYDSSSNDNYFNTTYNETNSSVTENTNIYNEQSQYYYDNSYYNEENNYSIDNSQVINNNTTIINNYYGNGDGGGGSGDDDDDDDLIWTALLKAIADFFKKIGELIATVLTGIVTILTSILDAIATIVSDFSGITDFLGQIFAWLPTEIITLMTLGLSTALFAAFLTWFKK